MIYTRETEQKLLIVFKALKDLGNYKDHGYCGIKGNVFTAWVINNNCLIQGNFSKYLFMLGKGSKNNPVYALKYTLEATEDASAEDLKNACIFFQQLHENVPVFTAEESERL